MIPVFESPAKVSQSGGSESFIVQRHSCRSSGGLTVRPASPVPLLTIAPTLTDFARSQ